MSDITYLGRKISSYESTPSFDSYSRVVVHVTDGVEFSAGVDVGRTLYVSCPWGTQAVADNLLRSLRGFQYQPYSASGALLDPAAELGDGVTVDDVYSGIYTRATNFGTLCRASVSAPAEEVIDHEFPYVPKQDRAVIRQNKQFKTQLLILTDQIAAEVTQRIGDVSIINGKLTVQADRITTEVTQRQSDVKELKSSLNVQADQIVAKVDRNYGSPETFGWKLSSDSWSVFAGSSTILRASQAGLEVTGKVTATSGAIGGFTINRDHISYNNQVWGGTNTTGIYVGVSGIQLGTKFRVDSSGNLYAHSGTFEGEVNAGSIRYGDSYGTLSGSAISAHSIAGGSLQYGTVSTAYTSSGINASLSSADFANGVFNGWNTAPTVQCAKVMCSGIVSMKDMMFDSHRVERSVVTVSTPGGGSKTLQYLEWF